MKPESASDSDLFKFIFGRTLLLAKQKQVWQKKTSLSNFV